MTNEFLVFSYLEWRTTFLLYIFGSFKISDIRVVLIKSSTWDYESLMRVKISAIRRFSYFLFSFFVPTIFFYKSSPKDEFFWRRYNFSIVIMYFSVHGLSISVEEMKIAD